MSKSKVNVLLRYLHSHPPECDKNQTLEDVNKALGLEPTVENGKLLAQVFYSLVHRGYAVCTARGKWALTSQGQNKAESRLTGVEIPAPDTLSAYPKHRSQQPSLKPALHIPTPVTNEVLESVLARTAEAHSLLEGLNTSLEEEERRLALKSSQVDILRKRVHELQLAQVLADAKAAENRVADSIRLTQTKLDQVRIRIADLDAETRKLTREATLLEGYVDSDSAESESTPEDPSEGPEGEPEGSGEDPSEGGGGDPEEDLWGKEGDKPESPPKGPTLTSLWLKEHLKPEQGKRESTLMVQMKNAVAAKCPLSAASNRVEDHVQEFLVKLLRRDALAKKIQAGEKITYSHMAAYAVHSAFTDARTSGTEPLDRESLGARTERERKTPKHETGNEIYVKTSNPKVIWGGEDDTPVIAGVVDDFDFTEDYQKRRDFEIIWAEIEDVLKQKAPQQWHRFSEMLNLKILGYSNQEIANKQELSLPRTIGVLQEAKALIKDYFDKEDLRA